MEKRFRVDSLLDGELAELYAGVLAQFERSGSLSLSEMNRALMQTGLLLHATLLTATGIAPGPEAQRLDELAERVGGDHLMWEVVELARRQWRTGGTGAIDVQA